MRWEKTVCGGQACRWSRLDICCTVLCLASFVITVTVVFVVTNNGMKSCGITIVTRAEWKAREPKATTKLPSSPVELVVIHHTSMAHCRTFGACAEEMRAIQDFHMDTRGWDDIGYNFVVGEDGSVYEARGWGRQGAHVRSWNDVSLGISVMGDFQEKPPDSKALEAVQSLITCGVREGYIGADYKLYGHRDMNPNTTCPGEQLYAQIQTWAQFDPNTPVHPNRPEL